MSDPIEATRRAQSRVSRLINRPFVCLSYAQSLDGSIAAQPGQPSAISSSAALSMTHQLRAAHDCLLIGIGTALADNPRLNVRLAEGTDPAPVILDSDLRLPPYSRLLAGDLDTHIFCTDPIERQLAAPLQDAGATIHPAPRNDHGLLDIQFVLTKLTALNFHSVMVEGGARVITQFLQKQLVDWLVITISPILLGGLRVPLTEPAPDRWTPTPVQIEGTAMFGQDLVIWGQPGWEAQ